MSIAFLLIRLFIYIVVAMILETKTRNMYMTTLVVELRDWSSTLVELRDWCSEATKESHHQCT